MPAKKTRRIKIERPAEAPVKVEKGQDPTKFKAAPTPDRKTKLHAIRIPAAEAGTTREEPVWDSTGKVGDQAVITRALNWYNYAMDDKNFRKCVEEWVRGTRNTTEADKLIKKLGRVPDKNINFNATYCSLMRAHMRGLPLSLFYYKLLNAWLDELVQHQTKEEKPDDGEKKATVSIQDRIKAQVSPVLGAIDFLTDCLLDSMGKADETEVRNLLHNPDFKSIQYKYIAEHIEKYLKEWNMALHAKKGKNEPDSLEADLEEGYKLITLKQLKNAIAVLSDLNGETRKSVEATAKPRKKRLRSPEKIVSKLKYKTEDKDLGLTSVDPKELLGASTLFLYNAKKRKLTKLVGEFAGAIDVKRSTIIGVNLNASATKTLRKPEEQLKELLALRKGAGDKWFDKIKSKGRKARARVNIETILLRVD